MWILYIPCLCLFSRRISTILQMYAQMQDTDKSELGITEIDSLKLGFWSVREYCSKLKLAIGAEALLFSLNLSFSDHSRQLRGRAMLQV